MSRPLTFDTYTLQTMVLPAGTVTVKLHINATAPALTIPSYGSITSIGEIVERMDSFPGEFEIENVAFTYLEDFGTYAEGFWHKVFGYWSEIQILLDEGSGDTHLFWGVIYGPRSQEEEILMTTGQVTVAKSGTFLCRSLLYAIEDTTIADYITELDGAKLARCEDVLNATTGKFPAGGKSERFMSIKALVGSICHLVFNQTYSADDCQFIGTNADIEFYCNSAWKRPDQIHVYWDNEDAGPFFHWDSTDNYYWDDLGVQNCLQYLQALCETFLLVPRYYYDTSASKHRIALMTRARSYSVATLTAPIQSTLLYQPYERLDMATMQSGVSATGLGDYRIYNGSAIPYASTLRGDNSVILRKFWFWDDDNYEDDNFASAEADQWIYLADGTADTLYRSTNCRYYDYPAAATQEISGSHFGSLAWYIYKKYSSGKIGYRRRYPGMQATRSATTTHTNVNVGITTTINDGVTDRTFYAAEVRKDVVNNQMTILWYEV